MPYTTIILLLSHSSRPTAQSRLRQWPSQPSFPHQCPNPRNITIPAASCDYSSLPCGLKGRFHALQNYLALVLKANTFLKTFYYWWMWQLRFIPFQLKYLPSRWLAYFIFIKIMLIQMKGLILAGLPWSTCLTDKRPRGQQSRFVSNSKISILPA